MSEDSQGYHENQLGSKNAHMHADDTKDDEDALIPPKPLNLGKRPTLIPEALPLFALPIQASMYEPELKYKMNRMNINRKVTMDPSLNTAYHLKRLHCRHLQLKDNQCLDCQHNMPHFKGSIFDTGNITTYLNIRYVNEYFDEQLAAKGNCPDRGNIIYENYKPKNVHEMREYILYVIDKSLKKANKKGQLSAEHIKILGQPNQGKNISSELTSYKALKKNRERLVFSSNVTSTDIDAAGLIGGTSANGTTQSEMSLDQQLKQPQPQYAGIGSHCLLFDSFFECGNLERAEYVNASSYNLYLNVDTNTKGHQQWFYFKVKNTFKDKRYIFTIKNFTKPFSLHKHGMRVLYRSKKHSQVDGQNSEETEVWQTLKEEAVYQRTNIQRSGWRIPGALNIDDEEDDDQALDDLNGVDGIGAFGGQPSRKSKLSPALQTLTGLTPQKESKRRRRYFYQLQFKVEFEFDNDEVYFAYSTPYPYSTLYTQMINYEQQLITSQKGKLLLSELKVKDSADFTERQIITKELVYERSMFAKTLSGLPVPVITITSRRHLGTEYKKRQGICISARVHPGETNSSFVYDGIMKFLLSYEGTQNLLHNYIFKMIPCLNPDGNVCGNYRSSLAGVDLNRQWVLPNKDIHPVVFKAKELLGKFSREREMLVYCDLHCHSKKMNSFIYGCNTAANGGFTSWTKTRLLPRILARQTPLFNIQDCRFRIDPDKIGTARVIIWKEFKVTNSFTLENSFFGYQHGQDEIPFTIQSYMDIGENLMRSLIEYKFCLKQIEKEMIVSNGWLKPKLLFEVTGTPAAKRIADEQAEQRKKEQKMKKIEQYKQNLGLMDKGKVKDSKSKIKVYAAAPQDDAEKTRNLVRTNTFGQNVITANSSSDQIQSKVAFIRQNSNQSESRVVIIKTIKRQSSSDSTNDLSMRKFTIIQDGEQKRLSSSSNKKRSQFGGKIKGGGHKQRGMSFKGAINKYQNQKQLSSFHKNNEGSRGETPKANITVKINQVNRRGSSNYGSKASKVDSENTSGDSAQGAKDWRAYFQGEELEEIFEQIEEGDDPNDVEDNMSFSEDDASEDNYDMDDLYKDVYLRGHLLDKEIKSTQKAEDECKRQFLEEIEETRLKAQSRKNQRSGDDTSKSNRRLEPFQILETSQPELRPKDFDPELLNIILEKDPYDHNPNDQIRIISKDQGFNHNQGSPSFFTSAGRKLNPNDGSNFRPTSQSTGNQMGAKYNSTIGYQHYGENAGIVGGGGSFTRDDTKYQQVFDTSFQNKDHHVHKTNLLSTFTVQNKNNQRILSNQKKPGADFRIPSRGIQGKGINNGGGPQIIQQRLHDTKGIDFLQPPTTLYHAQGFSSQNVSMSSHQVPTQGSFSSHNSPVLKINGFQQYIINNIKNENHNVQKAYSKLKNNPNQQNVQIKMSSMTINEISFDKSSMRDDFPLNFLNESMDTSHQRVYDSHNGSNPHHSNQKANFFQSPPPPQQYAQSQMQMINPYRSIFHPKHMIMVGVQPTIRTPLIGINKNSILISSPDVTKSAKSHHFNELHANPIFPTLKPPVGASVQASNFSQVIQESKGIKDMLAQQQHLRAAHLNAHHNSRRETMTEIGAQILESGHQRKIPQTDSIIKGQNTIQASSGRSHVKGSSSMGGGLPLGSGSALKHYENHSLLLPDNSGMLAARQIEYALSTTKKRRPQMNYSDLQGVIQSDGVTLNANLMNNNGSKLRQQLL